MFSMSEIEFSELLLTFLDKLFEILLFNSIELLKLLEFVVEFLLLLLKVEHLI